MIAHALLSIGCIAAATLQDDRPGVEPEALEVLGAAAERLEAASSFSFALAVSYDVVQASGNTVTFNGRQHVQVRRPDRLSMSVISDDGGERDIIYDGARLVIVDKIEGAYAESAAPDTVDAMVDFAADALGVPLPLGDLVRSDVDGRLSAAFPYGAYLGERTIDGVTTDHVVFANERVGVQLWIDAGDAPLLRQVIITHAGVEGEPQYRARVSDWNLSASLDDAVFAFTPEDGFDRIEFLDGSDAEEPNQ